MLVSRNLMIIQKTSIANRNSTCSMHDVVVARLGETYLIAAEAYLKMGKTEEAAQ